MIKRRVSRQIKIGNVNIGDRNSIAIQSMTKTQTSNVVATIKQIKELEKAGCDIVRVAVRDFKDAMALAKIKPKINIPMVADIHFDARLALKAIDSGVDKIRLNPGNIYKRNEIKEIAKVAKQAHIPIRVGVNSGSLRAQNAKRKTQNAKIMVNYALDYIKLLEGFGFYDIVVSLKSSDIFETIEANTMMAGLCDYPIHLGLTATGPSLAGLIKSAIVTGRLLSEGIGDTIRISLTSQPVEEVRAAAAILGTLGLRNLGPEIISCPTCGRCEVDLVKIVKELDKRITESTVHSVQQSIDKNYRLSTIDYRLPMKVAVMGCVVNGPGEARGADLGIAFGKKDGLLFKKGKPIRKVSSRNCVDALLKECFGQRHSFQP